MATSTPPAPTTAPPLPRWPRPGVALRALEAWLLPESCLCCGLPVGVGGSLCAPCREQLQPATSLAVPELEAMAVQVHAGLAYDAASAPLLTRYKFHGDLAAGRALAAFTLPMLRAAPRPQALVPVPLHRRRLRQRGHDQARGLAVDWGRALGLPVLGQLLQRERATSPQTELDGDARRRNLAGAFRATALCPPHVALVDDVLTTGSTAAAAVAALRAGGARRIEVWVAAQVPASSQLARAK